MKAGHSLLFLVVLAAWIANPINAQQTQTQQSQPQQISSGASNRDDAIGNCKQMPDGEIECDWIQYLKDLGMKAAFFVVLVLLLLVFGCVLFIGKCCDGFGGKEPSHGWCCGSKDPPVVYSHNMVMLAKGGSVAVVVLLLIGPIIVMIGATGLWGSGMDAYEAVIDVADYANKTAKEIEADLVQFKNNIVEAQNILAATDQPNTSIPGMEKFFKKGLDAVKNVAGKALDAVKGVGEDALNAVSEPLENLGDMLGGIGDWVKKIKESQALVRMVMMIFRIVCMGVVLVPLLIACKAVMCGLCCHKRNWSTWCCPSCSLWKFALVAFLGAGVFSVLHKLARGLDLEVQLAIKHDPESVLRGVIECDMIKFDDAEKLANETIAEGIDVACSSLLILCAPGSRWNCLDLATNTTYMKCLKYKDGTLCSTKEECDLTTEEFYQLPDKIYMKTIFLVDDPCGKGITQECTGRDCGGGGCTTDTAYRNNSRAFMLSVDSMKLVDDLIQNKIKPLLGCDALFEKLLPFFAPPITKLAKALGQIKAGLIVQGLLIITCVAFLFWAYKRFWKSSELEEQQKKLDAAQPPQPVVDPLATTPVVGVPVQPEAVTDKEWVDEYDDALPDSDEYWLDEEQGYSEDRYDQYY